MELLQPPPQLVPNAFRKAHLGEVAANQLALSPAQEIAAVPVDHRDTSFDVHAEEQYFGGVEVQLCEVSLLPELEFDALALEDFVVELVNPSNLS